MQENAYLKCIDIHCGLEYPISSIKVECDKGHLLDVKYKQRPSESLKNIRLKIIESLQDKDMMETINIILKS